MVRFRSKQGGRQVGVEALGEATRPGMRRQNDEKLNFGKAVAKREQRNWHLHNPSELSIMPGVRSTYPRQHRAQRMSSGRSAVRLARTVRVREVGGSNPLAPTQTSWLGQKPSHEVRILKRSESQTSRFNFSRR